MRPAAFVLLACLLPLGACQTAGLGGAQFQKMAAEQNALLARGGPAPKAMSDQERDELLATADGIQAEAPALTTAGMFGGLDPTGTVQSLAWAEQMRQAQKMQAHMPAMMADARFRADAFCKANPKAANCIEYKRMQAKAAGEQGR